MTTDHGILKIENDPTPWVIVQPNNDKEWCVLWLQGWKGSIEEHLERITRMAEATDISFAMLEYAGHGHHPVPLEETTREQQHLEVVAAYDELKARGYKKIIAIGGSFGAYMAALLAGKRELHSIILRAPAIYDDERFSTLRKDRGRIGYDGLKNLVKEHPELSALEAIRKFPKSVYVIEHELDSVIPKEVPQAYFEAAKHGNYLIVPATDHSPKLMSDPERHALYIETLLISLVKTTLLEDTLRED